MAQTRCESFQNPGVKTKMPKTPRDTENTAPKKRTRKTTTEASDGTKVVTAAKTAVTTMKIKEVPVTVTVEERIRMRAYELYLRRGGNGGSPEQDWLQAAAEVYDESVA
jgi:hypothetical protein